MTTGGWPNFFAAEAGASATLVGLIFVAASLVGERVRSGQAGVLEQARAASALTALITPLPLDLVALLPGSHLGITAILVGLAGILFVAATLRRYLSVEKAGREDPRGLLPFAGFTIVLGVILGCGVVDALHPSPGALTTLASATIASMLLGVNRAWALIDEHGHGRATVIRDLIRGEDPGAG